MSAPTAPARMRVRTKDDYAVAFLVDVGQRNAEFVRRPWTPLTRVHASADAFALLPDRDTDIVHAINAVPLLDKRPYVITFEDYLPRVPEDRHIAWLEARLQRELTRPRCIGIVAISEYALRCFERQNAGFAGLDNLKAKTQLIRPAVAVRRIEPKMLGERLHLLFVGSDFMRKGGPALLRAHARLRDVGVPVQTTVVSSLRWSPKDYIGPTSPDYVAAQTALLAQPGVRHVAELPNHEILDLMEDADFLVLPTLHDTFGYVSLEAMASGTPVIATATCAQPEIIEEGVSGHLLALENENAVGRWAWCYRRDEPCYHGAYEAAIASLAAQIASIAEETWNDRSHYRLLSVGALETVRRRFAPEVARERLEALYEDCRAHAPNATTPQTSAG